MQAPKATLPGARPSRRVLLAVLLALAGVHTAWAFVLPLMVLGLVPHDAGVLNLGWLMLGFSLLGALAQALWGRWQRPMNRATERHDE